MRSENHKTIDPGPGLAFKTSTTAAAAVTEAATGFVVNYGSRRLRTPRRAEPSLYLLLFLVCKPLTEKAAFQTAATKRCHPFVFGNVFKRYFLCLRKRRRKKRRNQATRQTSDGRADERSAGRQAGSRVGTIVTPVRIAAYSAHAERRNH